MQNLRAKILNRVSAKKNNKDDYIVELHDALMAEYGWIPFEEFKQLPIQTVLNLFDAASKRHKKKNEAEKKAMKKGKRR